MSVAIIPHDEEPTRPPSMDAAAVEKFVRSRALKPVSEAQLLAHTSPDDESDEEVLKLLSGFRGGGSQRDYD